MKRDESAVSAVSDCIRVCLLVGALLLAGPASASPEKAADFYENALSRYERDDVAGAIIQLRNAIREDNKMVAAHLLLGKAFFRNGELKAAEASFDRAQKLGISRVELAVPLAQLYLALGDPEQVIDKITPAGLPATIQIEVLSLRGVAQFELGNWRFAAESFAEARAIDPTSAVPLIAEVPMLLATGNADRAKATSSKAIALAPSNAQAWNMHASVLHATFDAAGALAAYDKALALEPKLVDARVARAGLLIDLKRDEDAQKDIDTLRVNAPGEPRAAYLRALLAGRKGDEATVAASLDETVKLIDALPIAWLARRPQLLMLGALSHYGLRNLERSRGYLETLLRREPTNLAAQKLLASVYVETGDYRRALTLLSALQRAHPNDVQVQYQLGMVYLARRQYVAATEALEKAAASLGSADAIRALGLSQLGQGQDALALANLEKSLAAEPGNTKTGMTLAMLYLQRGQSKKAIQTAETLVKHQPDNLTVLNFLGAVKAGAGDKSGARAAYQQAVSKDPQFLPAVLNLARLDASEGRNDDARKRLTDALAKRRDDPSVLYELGLLESRAGRIDEAVRYLQKADEVQRRDPRAALALIDIYLAHRRTSQALDAAKDAAGRYTTNPPVLIALARASLAADDSRRARQALGDAALYAESNPGLQVTIGRLQLEAGNPDGAFHSAQKALQRLAGDPDAMALLVIAEGQRGNTAKADAALKALAAKHPTSVQTALAAADLAMIRGNHAAAAASYRTALSRAETTANAISLARAQVAAGEAKKAAEFLEEWVKRRPGDVPALKALAEVQFRAGLLPAARESYTKAIAADPNDGAMLNNYANLLQQLKDPAAQAPAEQALRLDPNNAFYAGTLGWILVEKGETASGLRYLREARLRRPENGEIRFRLAFALAKSGRTQEAKDELAAALSAPEPVKDEPQLAALRKEVGL